MIVIWSLLIYYVCVKSLTRKNDRVYFCILDCFPDLLCQKASFSKRLMYTIRNTYFVPGSTLSPEDCVIEKHTHTQNLHPQSEIITKRVLCTRYCANPWAYKTEYDTFLLENRGWIKQTSSLKILTQCGINYMRNKEFSKPEVASTQLISMLFVDPNVLPSWNVLLACKDIPIPQLKYPPPQRHHL